VESSKGGFGVKYLQLHTLKGQWGVSYIDNTNWDNTCDLLSPEDNPSISEVFSTLRNNFEEGMGIYVSHDDALRLVLLAAENHANKLLNESAEVRVDPIELLFREAIKVTDKAFKDRIRSYIK
jgi:hypothetical protein